MLLTSHSIGTIKKNDIKSSIRGQAPITSFVVDSNTVYICHDLPWFSWRKLLKFDLVISTHRDIDEMLTSSLDYYFVRRRAPILSCPFDLLLLRKWQHFRFERRMKRLQAAEINLRRYEFDEIESHEIIEDLNDFLNAQKNKNELALIQEQVSDLRDESNSYDNETMSVGGFANPKKKYRNWKDLKPKTTLQKLKMKILDWPSNND